MVQDLVDAGYRTLAVEAPGINGTHLPAGEFGLYDLAADLEAVDKADAPGGEAVVGIGHAFGNRVVRAAATRYPELFAAVALLAAGGRHPVPEAANRALFNCLNPLRSARQRLSDIRYAFFAHGNEVPDYWRRGWHGQTASLQGRASAAAGDDRWLGGGEGPMLVVQDAADPIAPRAEAGDELLAAYPERVRLVIAEPAGHALLPEQPGLISRALLRFLAEVHPAD